MTASVAKSTRLTNLVADPQVVEASYLRQHPQEIVETIEVATTSIDEADDAVLVLPLPSNAVISSLVLFNDDLDSNGAPALAVDVGVYNGPEKFVDTDGSATKYAAYAEIDQDAFASAITTLQAANTAGVELRFEAANIDGIGKRLWEIAGLTSDPRRMLAVALTVTTQAATAAAGTVSVRARFQQ
jgi:hypothetical protein